MKLRLGLLGLLKEARMVFNSILTSVSLGLLSAGSPCILPLYPGFLAYLTALERRSSASAAREKSRDCASRAADAKQPAGCFLCS